ncbi:nucleoside deaminase [Mahella australiensis]|uniref:tRNA-specific adenosine deaminase n=1 Tax=Mahella australiensis (strain DSM 15567 / CIP 107919 / 50-1 BON) TaxID=697281 RepID=F3ZVT4_MAHA5|nr:nucleoside deaminase [Mahella australiensis]AEE97478.1 tRNA-adenosine deaminase [Mahella australiensis 50-1 BON]
MSDKIDRLYKFMSEAIKEAELAAAEGEVPIGAVVAKGDEIIGRGHNQVEGLHDATAHAEMLAIRQAMAAINDWRLDGCELYTTLEPCAMCTGAMMLCRIEQLIYGAPDLKWGCAGTLYNLPRDRRFDRNIEIIAGIGEQRCEEMLKKFFENRRNDN